ncbi:hypothetical protein [Salinisphaera shabanensis]|jgi:hypothetical protein|uniref:hypothetical protein n=1 Tax=Salinisphaera shabanensis TaxID=180542 RepID=UPI0033416047
MRRHLAWTGFNLGQIQIVLAKRGALLLALLATITRWLTGRMENQWRGHVQTGHAFPRLDVWHRSRLPYSPARTTKCPVASTVTEPALAL